MGDECCAAGSIGGVAARIRSSLGGAATVESLVVDEGASARGQVYASFFGDALRQVDGVCAHLLDRYAGVPVNLVGFSQGGQLLRAVVERCEGTRARRPLPPAARPRPRPLTAPPLRRARQACA